MKAEKTFGNQQSSIINPAPKYVESAKKADPDPRHAPIRTEIRRLYLAATEPSLPPPWTGHHGRALDRLLKANPQWPLDVWLRCVRNRFASDGVNLAEDPIRWLCRLPNYARGRLDKWGQPKRVSPDDYYAMTHAGGGWLSVVYCVKSQESKVEGQELVIPAQAGIQESE